MRTLLLAIVISAAASAQTPDTAKPPATVSIDARASAVIPGSSNRVTRSVPIAFPCTYVSHSLTVLEREPAVSSDTHSAAPTSFSAELRRAPGGRIEAVALTVVASVTPTLQPTSIGVRLAVVMHCE